MSVAPDDRSFLDRLAGVLGPNQQLSDLGLSLLANSGYSTTPRSFGQVLGTSALQAQQMAAQRQNEDIKNRYMQAQVQALLAKAPGPSSVQEYEYAVKNGFKGTFEEWQTKARGQNTPSDVLTYEYFSKLTPEQKADFLRTKRNIGSDFALATVNGVPTVVYKPAAGGAVSADGGTPLMTPLTTLPQEISAQSQLAGSESRAKAVGTGAGEIQTGIAKKASTANTVLGMLNLADPLIDAATGSLAGAGVDKLASVFGKAPSGAEAIAQLKVLQAGLMLNMPRMEGPQSDRDVQLYRESAAQLGDPTVPRSIKKAAISTIRDIQNKYKELGAQQPRILPNGSPEAEAADNVSLNSLLDKYAPRR